MVRGKNTQGNEKLRNLSSSDSKELQNDDDNTLPRGGSKKNYSLSSLKPDDEQKIFPTQQCQQQSMDDQQQQLQPQQIQQQKRGRGRPRKIPIPSTTITNNDIDQNSSSVSNSESSSSKITLNHQELNELEENLNYNSNDDQHNIISVIEIVDESQDDDNNCIIDHCNLDYSNESQINQNDNNLVEQHNENYNNQLQNDTDSIEEIINKPPTLVNFNDEDDDEDEDQTEIVKNESVNFNVEAKINTESIITISSDESNFKTELKSRDTPISELMDRCGGGAGDSVSSPDILHVHMNPNAARTYQNKRKSKIDTDFVVDNLSCNNNKLDNNILDLNQLKQNKIIEIEDNLQIQTTDNTIINLNNSIECRRSSRKKTMKYDVRDLLNKNRKKIQIEARIDSLPKKTNDNIIIGGNDIKQSTPDNNNSKLSPLLTGISKNNELHDIIIKKTESSQLNDKKNFSLPQLVSAGTNCTKNLIHIQSKKSFDNDSTTNPLPPPPPLKSIAELDRKIAAATPNGLFPNELNHNKIYSFHDAFNSGIIKSGGGNERPINQLLNLNSIDMPQIKNISSTIVSSSQTIAPPPPVLSSMVKSPLLNIKFKHQNLGIRKSFDSLINNTNSTLTNSLNDTSNQNTFKEIKSQLNVDEKSMNKNELNIEKIEKPIKVKGKRGRPPKNKLLSPQILDNSLDKIKQGNCKIENKIENLKNNEEKSENHNLIQSPVTQKSKNQNLETLEKLSTDNKVKDCKNNDVIENSDENDKEHDSLLSDVCKEDKIIEKLNHSIDENNINTEIMPQETVIELQNISKESVVVEHQIQNIGKETPSNIVQAVQKLNTENIISTEQIELQNELQYKFNNKVKEGKSSPTKKKKQFEFGDKVETIEKTSKNLKELFRTHSINKKKTKDFLSKESSTKLSSYNSDQLQETVDRSKQHKEYKKNVENKDGKTLLSKAIEKSEQNERKTNFPQTKLFLETEKIHELKFQKSERKKLLQIREREHVEKSALKKLKKISVEEGQNVDQTKSLVEMKEMKTLAIEKSQEEYNIFNTKITAESEKEISRNIENKLISSKSRFSNEVEKMAHQKDDQHSPSIKMNKLQKDIQFEKLAEKLIENEICSKNCNENQEAEQNNELIPKFEEILSSMSSVSNDTEKNIKKLQEVQIDDTSFTTKIISKSENIIHKEDKTTDNLINKDNCLENLIFNDVTDQKELFNQKEIITIEENQKFISNVTIPNDNDNKILPLNSSTDTLSASISTDSNDPLKDIEKFLEAAGNLLSRSLSSEDEKDPSRRRGRSGTRFKDCGTKDDDDDSSENNTKPIEFDVLEQKSDKEYTDKSTSQISKDNFNIFKFERDELKIKDKLGIENSKIDKEEQWKTDIKGCTKTDNLEKSLCELQPNQIHGLASTLSDYQNISNNIKSENNESNPTQFLPNIISIQEFPKLTNESLNFSHKFPSQESSNLSLQQQPIEKRTPGPRTPPFPPPNDLQIDEDISFLQNSSKSEESLLNIENSSNTIVIGPLDFHSDSMTSNSNSSKSTDSKCIKTTKSSKQIENDLKLIKKLKRKDERKLKKKDGITDELKRTIKEMKKIKKSSSTDLDFIQGTLSKAAMKSYSPVRSIMDICKPDGDSRSLDDLLDLDENQIIYDQNNTNIRRSHRIKTITKSQLSVGRGLVRDRERYDKEYDDIKPDLAVIDAQNAKFLKDMEERLSQFQVIRDNEYKCERVISKEAKKMICDCFMTRDEEERGEFGCGEDCLNRLLMIECGPKCTVGDRCTNRRFQRAHYAPCKVFQTDKKGCGIMADAEITCGQFIMEYVGEVLNSNQFEKRAEMYSLDKNKHYYFMALRSDAIIDATTRGNISRFINHSCDPNAETQKWTVNGELRIGFFTTRTILPGEEITFDYQFQRYGKEAQRCYCETSNCRGWIGEEPDDSDEEELEDESEDDEKIKTDIKKEISQKIIKEIPNDQQQNIFKPKSVQEISQKTETTDVDKENIEIIKTKPDNKKEKKKRGRKKRLDFRLGMKSYEFIDDPDLEDEVLRLLESGLKNQVQTLCLSRLFVRAKQLETRINLLQILGKGEMSCRRLFLDYHGLKLLHGWMSETTELIKDTENDFKIRLKLLETLECLPIPNKTMLKDSKVFQTVQNWSLDKTSTESSPNDGSPNDNSNSGLTTPINVPTISKSSSTDFVHIHSTEKPIILNSNENLIIDNPVKLEIKRISTKLISNWDCLPEVFRIPRKERVEQMKEHEREADKQYAALKLVDDENDIRRNRGRFIKEDIKDISIISNNTDLTPGSGGSIGKYKWSRDIKNEIIKERRKEFEKSSHQDGLSKLQRRQIFAAKVAQDEAEKRLADEKREFDIKCKFYGLDPLTTHPRNFPFCVNPATGQWYTIDRRKIPTPPSHAHIKVPPKPQSTKPEDYQLPLLDLPPFWKFAIDPHKGRIYYYHVKIRIPQWEPPIKILPLNNGTVSGDGFSSGQIIPSSSKDIHKDENDSSDSGSDSCDSLNDQNKDEITADGKLSQTLNPEQKKLERKKKRYALLVQERPISPRREEDRQYNQIEMRRYKENKEKIRRRKEEIKRRKIQLARHLTDQQNNPDLETDNNDNNVESVITDENNESDSGVSATSNSSGIVPLPIADYLLSSDEEEIITTFCDAKLIEKIVKGEKIVDELDVLNINRPIKRLLSFKEKNISNSTISSVEHKSKKSKIDEKKLKNDDEIKKPKSSSKLNNPKYLARKAKEKFRSDIAGIIVLHLTPYRKDTCKTGRITKNEDFKHLARKLTHFVMVKELKHCDLTGQQLIVTDSVKNKSREFIKKYMAKYGEIYIRPENDPEFKEIPH